MSAFERELAAVVECWHDVVSDLQLRELRRDPDAFQRWLDSIVTMTPPLPTARAS